MRLCRFLYIFLIPLLIILLWFAYEKKESYFSNFQLKAGYYEPEQLEEFISNLPQINEAARASTVPAKFFVKEKENSLGDISAALNQTILDRLGYFADLPLHKACLINRNRITSEGELVDPSESNTGAIGIIPTVNESLNLYVEIWQHKDCKSVFKKDFEDEKFLLPEYVYPIFREIGPEDMGKIYRGESYKIYLREVSIDASESRLVLRLGYEVVFIAYLILTFVWSLIYFQIRKIIYHIRRVKDDL